MKLIEALKNIKRLKDKQHDLITKIKDHCADMDYETPFYGDTDTQQKAIDGWLQSVTDIGKEILSLNIRIQRTNLGTDVTIAIPKGEHSVDVTHSISAWILRRRSLNEIEQRAWAVLTNRGLSDRQIRASQTEKDPTEMKVRLYFDPAARDSMQRHLLDEYALIDSSLEVVNATTDLSDD
jgi:hypothetical protein